MTDKIVNNIGSESVPLGETRNAALEIEVAPPAAASVPLAELTQMMVEVTRTAAQEAAKEAAAARADFMQMHRETLQMHRETQREISEQFMKEIREMRSAHERQRPMICNGGDGGGSSGSSAIMPYADTFEFNLLEIETDPENIGTGPCSFDAMQDPQVRD
jgi:hypothetical protein